MVWFFKKKKNKDDAPKDQEKPDLEDEVVNVEDTVEAQDETVSDDKAQEKQDQSDSSDKDEPLTSQDEVEVLVQSDLSEQTPLAEDVSKEDISTVVGADAKETQEPLTEETLVEEVVDEIPSINASSDESSNNNALVEQDVSSVNFFDFKDDESDAEKAPEEEEEVKEGWFARLTKGLSKSSSKISDSISAVFTKSKLDDDLIEELEDVLITSDLGPVTAAKLVEEISKDRYGKDVTDEEIKKLLSDEVEKILSPVEKRLSIFESKKPFVVLMSGVNGAGKTTTIGKIGHLLKSQGKSVMMAAGDTFRAAAIEQLTVWGERSGIEVFSKAIGADAAALAYEAYESAIEKGVDVLIIDTAGRLQNKKNLMEELTKIVRVLKKKDEDAPHSRLIVLDATTGQNAHSQIEAFSEAIDLTGMIMTKLDGSAKGGVLVSLADKYKLPIHAIGIGESIEDLRPFEAKAFARSLMGLSIEEE